MGGAPRVSVLWQKLLKCYALSVPAVNKFKRLRPGHPPDAVWDSITLNGLFTSKACNRFGICATVKWFIKLQVDSGSILNCAQSLDGLLGQPKTCP